MTKYIPRLRKKLFFISLPLIINLIYRKTANTYPPLSFYDTIFYKFIQENIYLNTIVSLSCIDIYFSSSMSLSSAIYGKFLYF